MALPIITARGPSTLRRSAAALISLSVAGASLLIFGCGQTGGSTAGVGSTTTSAGGASAGDSVIATVNKDTITQSQVYDQLQRFVPSRLPGYPNTPLLNEPAGRYVLQTLITNLILVQTAADQKVPVTPDEVEARYTDQKMVSESQSTQTFEQALAADGITPDNFKQSTIVPAVARYNLLTRGVTGTDQEYQAYYNSHQTDYTEPNRVHLERAVFPSQAAAVQAYATASKAKSLAGVIPPNTPTPPGAAGPADIPEWIPISPAPTALKPLEAQLAKAAPGTVLPPTQVQGQWWVTRVVESRPKSILKYDQVKHIIEWTVLSRKAQASESMEATQKIMQAAQHDAQITITPPQFQSLAQQIKDEASAPGGQP